MEETDEVGFDVTEEVLLGDLDGIQNTRQLLPVAQGVRVRIEKPSIKKSLSDNAKDAPKEGPENPVGYKYFNAQFRLLDGITVPIYDDNGNATGETELKFKNKVLFAGRMDFVFWHNPEVKTSPWWKDKQYIFGFRALCKACGIDTKQVKINDELLEAIKDKEVLIDIEHEEEQENKNGEWVGKGTFKERIKNVRPWS